MDFSGLACSLSGQPWRLAPADDRLAAAIAQGHGVPEVIGRLLAGRGIGLDAAAAYLNPSLKHDLPDPSHLVDMDKAAARLAEAVQAGETIGIFGDYDVDGATSSALLKRFFDAVGAACRVYIPDRLKEGYGPNAPALRALQAQGVGLVVTVDCGSSAHEALTAADAAGLPVIIADHHQAEPPYPPAYAHINPNRHDANGEHGQLAAVGVVFLLVVALNRALRAAGWYGATRREPDLRQWLDLVALGTVCDVVPLTGVNRALVTKGFEVMARRANVGLAALCDVANLAGPPGAYQAGFILGPRVNAGGRVGQADLGVRLLSSDDGDLAGRLARELDTLNTERRAIEAGVLEAASAQIARQAGGGQADNGPVVIAADAGWHPGVIGIVASRLKERYRRPAIVIGAQGKGSGRSINGVDLGAAIVAAREAGLLINGGGHKMAAGLTLEAGRLDALRDFLAARLAGPVAAAASRGGLTIDGVLAVGGATVELLDQLEQAGPFGAGNPTPRFVLAGARVIQARAVGAEGAHVSCFLGGQGARLKAIAFRPEGALAEGLLRASQTGQPLYVAGTLRADYWRGERRAQFHIIDAAFAAKNA
jgi:single-stranded-DNA-specific exonuclease